MIRILDDDSPISCIHFDKAKWSISVNRDGITKIEAYGEAGEMAQVPWIAVWKGNKILYRFPARMCRIEYKCSIDFDHFSKKEMGD